MTKKNNKGSFIKKLLLILVAFGPGTFIFLMAVGKCENQYQELPVFAEMPAYEFVGVDGNIINNETQKGRVTIFTTLQTSCPQNCAIDFYKFNLLVYQHYRKNQRKLDYVDIISIVTDEKGNPVENISEVSFMIDDLITGYDSTLWNVVSGDPKQIYDIESNGINLYNMKVDSAFGGKAFLETMLIVDKQNKLRLVRRGDSEGMIRDFKQHVSLLQEQYDREDKELEKSKE